MSSLKCNFEAASIQQFSLPSPTIKYLLNSANANQLKKLYETCKYFYANHQVHIFSDVFFVFHYPAKKGIKQEDLNGSKCKFWLTKSLCVENEVNITQLFKKITKCEIEFLFIGEGIHFTIDDLQFLSSSGKLDSISIQTKVHNNNSSGNEVGPIEEIFSLLPNAFSAHLQFCNFTENSMENLCALKQNEIFSTFELIDINRMLDVDLVMKYLTKNVQPDADVMIHFESGEMNLPQIFPKISKFLTAEKLDHFYDWMESESDED